MVNISIGTAALTAVLGYAVVFLGIAILLAVILLTGVLMNRDSEKQSAQKAAPKPAAAGVVDLGEIKAPAGADPLKVAIMAAIVADMEREG